MTTYVFANNVLTKLAAASSSSAVTLTLASSTNLPTLASGQQLPVTLVDAATGLVTEICYATAISGVTLTVIRAQEGTGAQNWAIGDEVFCAATAGTMARSLMPTMPTSDNSNNLASTAFVQQVAALYALLNGSSANVFNVANALTATEAVALAQSLSGATFSVVTTSRAIGVVYTNSSARARIVFVDVQSTSTAGTTICVINGVQTFGASWYSANAGVGSTFVIPVGATYEVTGNTGAVSLITWQEIA